jgi:hypothetical protein
LLTACSPTGRSTRATRPPNDAGRHAGSRDLGPALPRAELYPVPGRERSDGRRRRANHKVDPSQVSQYAQMGWELVK